jgi:hypothetical protein
VNGGGISGCGKFWIGRPVIASGKSGAGCVKFGTRSLRHCPMFDWYHGNIDDRSIRALAVKPAPSARR